MNTREPCSKPHPKSKPARLNRNILCGAGTPACALFSTTVSPLSFLPQQPNSSIKRPVAGAEGSQKCGRIDVVVHGERIAAVGQVVDAYAQGPAIIVEGKFIFH